VDINKEKLTELISEESVQKRVKEIAADISQKYEGDAPILIGILNGSFIFCADLMREMSELTYEDQPVFRWIRPREQLYKGSYIDRYPDILYEMVPQLGSKHNMRIRTFAQVSLNNAPPMF